MLLPSGNDAAYSIGESMATLLYNGKKDTPFYFINPELSYAQYERLILKISLVGTTKDDVFNLFFDKMNQIASENNLNNSKFSSFHGLPDKNNVSTAYEVAKLSRLLMQNVV